MRSLALKIAALLILSSAAAFGAKPEFDAGAVTVDITPQGPIWLSGYASRTKPSEGVLAPIHAKALALRDKKGYRVVIVTADVVGLPRAVTDAVAARLEKEHSLRRAQVVFNSSHTHTGPVVWPNLSTMYFISPEEKARLQAYALTLSGKLFDAAAGALGNLAPASISFGEGSAPFAMNRRQKERGPVDHSVPVFDIRDAASGKRKAILFGYACHNTTLTGEHYKISGDYAGYAQTAIEAQYPGAVALFLMLAGADQNPTPRGEIENAEAHGLTLAASVSAVLEGKMTALRSPVKSAYQTIDLAFVPHTRDQFEAEAKDENRYKASRARAMLAAYDSGHPIRTTPYPVQAIRFAPNVTLVALGGEVVVDYARRYKDTFGDRLIVAGYSNDVMCYIPSLRVLREGGYEGDTSMIYYGQPGKFNEDVEEDIFGAVRRVLDRVGGK